MVRNLRPWKLVAVASAVSTMLGACAVQEDTAQEEQRYTGARVTSGRWIPVQATGDNGVGSYEGVDGSKCAGGLKPGAKQLGDQLKSQFSEISEVGGYSCRDNTAHPGQLSIHAFGRALDLMTNDGTALANHLVKNSRSLGIQLIIWNHTIWQVGSGGATSKQYSGPNPHTDHVHAEVTRAVAAGGPGAAEDPTTTEPSGPGEDETEPTSPGTSPRPTQPTQPTRPGSSSGGFDPGTGLEPAEQCRTAKDCDPSGQVACFQGMCEIGSMNDEFECSTARDCDPSGSMACNHGFCDIGQCTQLLFNLGVCE